MQQSDARASAIDVPRTKAELDALRAHRRELSQLFHDVTVRRGSTDQERLNALGRGNKAMVAEMESKVKELGIRSARIERQLNIVDKAIEDATLRGVETAKAEATTWDIAKNKVDGVEILHDRAATTSSTAPTDLRAEYWNYGSVMLAEALAFVLLGVVGWRLAVRRAVRNASRVQASDDARLHAAVDAIAIEVERISENQRFVTKLLNDKLGAEVASAPSANAVKQGGPGVQPSVVRATQ